MMESSLCNSLINAPSVADLIKSMGLDFVSVERVRTTGSNVMSRRTTKKLTQDNYEPTA